VSFSFNVERALAGRCIICGRKLPKRRIPIYRAAGTHWEKGMTREKHIEAEVCVCGENCLARYEDGETGQASTGC